MTSKKYSTSASNKLLVKANWPLEDKIVAFTTTANGGKSTNNYASFNLSFNVGDNPALVAENRQLLLSAPYNLPYLPNFIQQCHSTHCLTFPQEKEFQGAADASYTRNKQEICAVLTADCIPLLVSDQNASQVAAIHAGWKGLLDGVVENTIAKFTCPRSEILVWIGPCIGKQSFQIGNEVREAFIKKQNEKQYEKQKLVEQCFTKDPKHNQKWYGDLPKLAFLRLLNLHLEAKNIYFSEVDTYTDLDFFSYRRKNDTGRMSSIIYIKS